MDRPLEVGARFGIDENLWTRNWAELSGGEGQRIMMAIGVALGTAEVFLLDGEFPLYFFFTPPTHTQSLPLIENVIIGSDTAFFFRNGLEPFCADHR